MGDHRSGRRRCVPLRRCGRDVEEDERVTCPPAASLVLLAYLRGHPERRHGLRDERGLPPLERRRRDLRSVHVTARRPPRSMDRPGRQPADGDRRRRRRAGLEQRRGELDDLPQPTDGAVLPGDDGQPLSVSHLRRSAGQLHGSHQPSHAGRVDHRTRLGAFRRRRERALSTRPRQSRHRLRGQLQRLHDARRPRDGANAIDERVARQSSGLRRRGHEVPVQLELPRPVQPPRLQQALRRLEPVARNHGRRSVVDGDQSGFDTETIRRRSPRQAVPSPRTTPGSSTTARSSP